MVKSESDKNALGANVSYGISVSRETETVAYVPNISENEKALAELVEKCNREQLEPIHLDDVIEDFCKEVAIT